MASSVTDALLGGYDVGSHTGNSNAVSLFEWQQSLLTNRYLPRKTKQANVLSPHYQRLIESISLSTTEAGKEKAPYKVDFEELQRAHASFLQRVREGCLLVSAECSESIHRLLTLCLDFCQFVEERLPGRQSKKRRKVQKTKTAAEIVREWTQSFADKDDDEDDWTREVNRFEEEFTRISEKFFHLVSKQPPNLKTSGNLDILLMQLDYNTWYTGNRLYISR